MTGLDEQRNDETVLLMAAVHALPLLAGVLAVANDNVRRWLLEHGVLLEPERSLWVLPLLDVGLDLVRIVILVAVLALLVLVPLLWIRARRTTQG